MAGITRLGDISTGHICYPGTPLTTITPGAGGPVYVNNVLAGRLGDLYTAHACTTSNPPPPHTIRAISKGSTKLTYINGKPPGIIGGLISCGDTITVGSTNVFAP